MEKLAALEAILKDDSRSPRDKAIARAALDKAKAIERGVETDAITEPTKTTAAYQELTPDSLTMLQALGKRHLRDISEDAFVLYAHHFDPRFKQELCRQWREWVCPDDAFLDLIGLSRAGYWRTIYDHAKSEDVRLNAEVLRMAGEQE